MLVLFLLAYVHTWIM